jgi:SAM-dependent methyltransferase
MAREFVRLASRAVSIPMAVVADFVFDLTSGVRTRGVLHPGDEMKAASVGGDPKSYGTTPLTWWRQMRSALPMNPAEATFIDLGAGRGRALILAAKMGFRRVIGVELDASLAKEAEENIERWLGREKAGTRYTHDIEVVVQDAATFEFPPGPLVIGLFNPFGSTTLEQVLGSLCSDRSSSEAEVYVAYFYPRHADVFEQFPELILQTQGRQWLLYRLQPAALENGAGSPG